MWKLNYRGGASVAGDDPETASSGSPLPLAAPHSLRAASQPLGRAYFVTCRERSAPSEAPPGGIWSELWTPGGPRRRALAWRRAPKRAIRHRQLACEG